MAIANRRVQFSWRNAVTHANGFTDGDADSNSNSDGYSNSNTETNANAQSCSDTETPPNTSTAPVALIPCDRREGTRD